MKTTTLTFFSSLVLAGCMVLVGCTGNHCKDVVCINGECIGDACVCNAGYEGLDCGTAINAKFSGSYSNLEFCQISLPPAYLVTVAPKSGSQTEATFEGLWELPLASATAVIGSNGTSFTIANQPLGTSGWNIAAPSGSITADGNTITITYTIYNDTTIVETCTASMSR